MWYFLSSVCLSETVYLHEEVHYIFLLALILSILESNSDRGIRSSILVIAVMYMFHDNVLFWYIPAGHNNSMGCSVC
jgi:hypothetical protein